jgi:hypothetical protein
VEARPLEQAPVRGPIFIIGSMGSGTTLLRLMLDSHRTVAVPHETGFMRIYNSMRFVPFKWTGRGWARRLGWTDEELDEELRAFFDRIFMRYAERTGKQRWGEKTPIHTWHIGSLRRLFPDAVFVAIVRHPGAAIASNMNRFRQPVGKALTHYERYNKEIARQAARQRRRMVLIRYEDLLLHTEPVLRELLDWLGEPWDPAVLEHHVVQAERDHKRIEGKTRADQSVDASRIAKWATELAADDRRAVRERVGRLGELFGYSMDDPAALAPLHERGSSLLWGGREVATRIEDFPDLEIAKRMPVPIYERPYHPRHFTMIKNPWGSKRGVDPAERDRMRAEAAGTGGGATPLRRAARPLVRAARSARRRLRAAR